MFHDIDIGEAHTINSTRMNKNRNLIHLVGILYSFNYITKETRILTVIGIFFGLFGGYFLSMYAVKTCELDMMMFNYEISKMCFIYGIIITIMFAEIVNLAVNRTLKKISMTESLKSVD